MRNWIFLCIILFFFISCETDGRNIERIKEDGIEVIINHTEPYVSLSELSTLLLSEEFNIDTAHEKILKIGLADISDFDVDSFGNIYCVDITSPNFFIFKFDKNGKYVDSFGKRGEGPGEIQGYVSFNVNSQNEIEVYQIRSRKLTIFGDNGNLIRERRFISSFSQVNILENGNYLIFGPSRFITSNVESQIHTPLSLFDNELKKIKELDVQKTPNPARSLKVKYSNFVFQWSISENRIFVVNEERGYEIYVYDFDGHLIKKIRKEYLPVPVPEEMKQKFSKNMKRFIDKTYFPSHLGPFQGIFTDDHGRLIVMTYEKGPESGEYIHDIFDQEGIFISRLSLSHSSEGRAGFDIPLPIVIKNGRFYYLHESEAGYKKLAVLKIEWE